MIVVIGILAAIALVGFGNIQTRAHEASIRSDLIHSAQQLHLHEAANGAYPTADDCSAGDTPPPPSICLHMSPGNSVTSYSADNSVMPPRFLLKVNGYGLDGTVTESTPPSVQAEEAVVAQGGTVTHVGSDTVHTFSCNGTFTVTGGPISGATILVVGGGGGGGGSTFNPSDDPNGAANTGSGGAGGGRVRLVL